VPHSTALMAMQSNASTLCFATAPTLRLMFARILRLLFVDLARPRLRRQSAVQCAVHAAWCACSTKRR
jgi:hypothetical protein